jgi:AhpD family alkylhydroperoxidase
MRVDYLRHQRDIQQAMLGVHNAIEASGLERSIIELVNIRASQINGCAYCLSLHIPDARKAGVTDEQIGLISAWREAGTLYSERERAALAWTEQNTLIASSGDDDEAWAMVTAAFDDEQALALTWAVAAINTWNRLAVPMRRPILDWKTEQQAVPAGG